MTNGISALQNTTVIMGLPFSFVIFFVMAGLYKSLKVEDYRRVSASRDTAPRPMGLQDRLSWKKRLSRLMNYPGTRYTKQMMETVCYPAMEEVAQELRLRGAAVELKSLPPEEGENLGHLDLLVHMGDEQNFIYKIWPDGLQQRAGDHRYSRPVRTAPELYPSASGSAGEQRDVPGWLIREAPVGKRLTGATGGYG